MEEMPLKKGRILERRIPGGVVIVDVKEEQGFIVRGNKVVELKPKSYSRRW